MGLFNLFRKNRVAQLNKGDRVNEQKDISGAMFVEGHNPLQNPDGITPAVPAMKGIEEIYAFLQGDYESKGYNDALTNPDESYRTDNVSLLKFDLSILIQKVTSYYEDMLKELNFHITSRGRAGLIDLVDVLKTRKEVVEEHLSKVNQIRNEMESNTGMMQRIILSYQRGFMRGLSAISQANILKKDY